MIVGSLNLVWERSAESLPSNRMLASASESVVVTVAVAVLNRQTWSLFEGVKVERAVVLFSVVLPWEVSLLSPESPVRLHMVFPVTFTTTIPWVALGYLVVAQAVMAKLIMFDKVQPFLVFFHCIATDRSMGSSTVVFSDLQWGFWGCVLVFCLSQYEMKLLVLVSCSSYWVGSQFPSLECVFPSVWHLVTHQLSTHRFHDL